MAGHTFCRDISIARGEPLEGDADLPEAMLLVFQPRSLWGDAQQHPAMAAAIEKAWERTGYVTGIDRTGDSDSMPGAIFFPGNKAIWSQDPDVVAAAIAEWADGGDPGEPMTQLTVICCTDSKVDACCAKYGFATYKALAASVDPEKVFVVQSRHIGGCHFAASLAIPARRQRYGRLAPVDVPAFLATILEGRIFLPAYRGTPGEDAPRQVAELAAMRWAEKTGRPESTVALLPLHSTSGVLRRYTARVGAERVGITVEARDFEVFHGCDAVKAGDLPELETRWLVRDIALVGAR